MFSRSFAISATRVRGHRHHAVDRRAVEREPRLEAGRRRAAHDLRDGARVELLVARVFPFGREDDEEVLARLQALRLGARAHLLVGGAGVGGALQRQELPGPQVRQQRVHRARDVAHVRLARLRERRRHADDERVGARGERVVRGGLEAALERLGDAFGGHRADVAAALAERLDLRRVDVEADRAEAGLGEAAHERQAHVAQADHAHGGGRSAG
jgi:hypothetical protein